MVDSRPMSEKAMAFEIRASDVDELRTYGSEMFAEHYLEVADTEVMQLEPNWTFYYDQENRGVLVALTVWCVDTEALAGYSVSVFGSHRNYAKQMVMENLLFFIRKPYRSLGLAGDLLSATAAAAKEAGCVKWTTHAKPGTAFDKVLARKKLKLEEKIYSEVV